MRRVTGIFETRAAAQKAIAESVSAGVSPESITFFTPEMTENIPDPADVEGKEVGRTAGTYVGAVLGAGAGAGLGTALASLAVPGVGPILAAGIGAAALLGVGGGAIGHAAGKSSEEGLDRESPAEDSALYRELLKNGRSIVVVNAASEQEAEKVHAVFSGAGSLSVESGRGRQSPDRAA